MVSTFRAVLQYSCLHIPALQIDGNLNVKLIKTQKLHDHERINLQRYFNKNNNTVKMQYQFYIERVSKFRN